MSYAFRIGESVDRGVRRIAVERIEHAVACIDGAASDRHAAVHEVRKDCKRIRGLLRLFRPEVPELYDVENRFFRAAARSLSNLRDAEAAIETYDALMDALEEHVDRQAMGPIRRALTLHRERLAADEGELDDRLASVRDAFLEATDRVSQWELPIDRASTSGFDLLGGGLAKTYARGRTAMERAQSSPSIETFHDWRKRAKYLRYHLRLVRPVWPALLKPSRQAAKTLSDLLGDDHDLAVLREVLPKALGPDTSPERVQTFESLLERRSAELRTRAHWLGLRVYAEKPKALRKRIGAYWQAAQQEHGGAG